MIKGMDSGGKGINQHRYSMIKKLNGTDSEEKELLFPNCRRIFFFLHCTTGQTFWSSRYGPRACVIPARKETARQDRRIRREKGPSWPVYDKRLLHSTSTIANRSMLRGNGLECRLSCKTTRSSGTHAPVMCPSVSFSAECYEYALMNHRIRGAFGCTLGGCSSTTVTQAALLY